MDRRLGKVLGMGWRIFEGFFFIVLLWYFISCNVTNIADLM